MSTVLAQREEVIKAPELRGAVLRLFDDPGLEQGIDGAAGCVAGETRIYNPVTGEHVPVKELYEKRIAPMVQTLMGAIQAEVPFRKGVRDLYRVTLSSGRQCVVTDNHLFLTPSGWRFARDCPPGTCLLVSDVSDTRCREGQSASGLLDAVRQSDAPFQQLSLPHGPIAQVRPRAGNIHRTVSEKALPPLAQSPDALRCSLHAASEYPTPSQSVRYSEYTDNLQGWPEVLSQPLQRACAASAERYDASPHPSIEAPALLVSPQDALRLSCTPLGFQDDCPTFHQGHGEPPLREAGNALAPAPSQDGALSRSHVDQHMGVRGTSPEYSRLDRYDAHRAMLDYSPWPGETACTQSHFQQGISLQAVCLSQSDVPFQTGTHLPLPTVQSLPDDDSTCLHELLLGECPASQEVLKRGVLVGSTLEQSMPYYVFADMKQGSSEIPLQMRVYNPLSCSLHSLTYTCRYDYTVLLDAVSSIEYLRTDEYFDLHVPIANHYLAEGIWHHNTGKTFAIMYVIHCLLSMYPGTKWLVARKRHVDLVGSALATFRESILDERENVHFFSGNKERPAAYEYPNGSLMVVNGLDRPGKVKSMDFDGMYICEATDCDLEDIEMCHIRLARRKDSKLPKRFQKLLMDFNPSFPDHFLNLRMNSGLTHRLNSRHEDNPFLYDAVKQDWTEAGRRYIAELETLTGARLARYRYGIWAASEGAIYEDSFDRARNVIARADIRREYPRYLIVDFGFVHPFVCLWAAQDNDGRLIVYRQLYRTKRLVEDHAKDIAIASGWFHLLPKDHPRYQDRPADWADPLPRDVICDHDSEDRATLEKHLKLYTTPAKKSVSDGIQAVASRLRPAGDGKPRLMIVRDSVVERDQELARAKRPTCTEDEFDSYTWDTRQGMSKGEQPVKELDDGMDCIRYLCAYHDLTAHTTSYFKNPWR